MVRQRIGNTAALLIFVLGFIGFGHLLATDPGQLVRYLLLSAVVMLILFAVYRFFLAPRMGPQDKRYRKVARQTQKKGNPTARPAKGKPSASTKHKTPASQGKVTKLQKRTSGRGTARTSAPHLTVIDGKKSKKKKKIGP